MLPGSGRDTVVTVAKVALPVAAFILAAVLIALPLTMSQEFSFLLSKDSAMRAGERMALEEALYRGQTLRGEPFRISARSGVQKSTAVPIVVLSGLSAEIDRADGPAVVTAPSGEFLIDENRVIVNGPIAARSASGYRLDGARIIVDINANRIHSDQPVAGTLPMGRFRADTFDADIDGRRVILDGGVAMQITPDR